MPARGSSSSTKARTKGPLLRWRNQVSPSGPSAPPKIRTPPRVVAWAWPWLLRAPGEAEGESWVQFDPSYSQVSFWLPPPGAPEQDDPFLQGVVGKPGPGTCRGGVRRRDRGPVGAVPFPGFVDRRATSIGASEDDHPRSANVIGHPLGRPAVGGGPIPLHPGAGGGHAAGRREGRLGEDGRDRSQRQHPYHDQRDPAEPGARDPFVPRIHYCFQALAPTTAPPRLGSM